MIAGLLVAAPSAGAHELGVVLVVPPRAEGATASPGLEGFRLAVDQSPDVSHPAGPEAGDHLGGIDVDLTLVRSRSRRDAAARVERAVSDGAGVVVVLRRRQAAADRLLAGDILSRVRPSDPLVLVAGSRGSLPVEVPQPVVLLDDRTPARIEPTRLARFERQFARRYRRSPGRAARRGYDAGRLLDRLLARLGEGPFRSAAVAAAVPAADRSLIAGTAELVRAAPDREDASASRSDATSEGLPTLVVLLAAVAALVAALRVRPARQRRQLARRRRRAKLL